MAATALVQTRIDPEIRDKASEILAKSGLTVSDVTRIVLTRIANEGFVSPSLVTPDEEYDAWFRAMVQEALNDPRPTIPGEEVEAYFAQRRAGLKPKAPWDDEA
jgi:DNA-damage-inducible protein J